MSYNEQLQSLYHRYEKDGHMQSFTMHDLASWAYDNDLCQPQRSTIVNRLAVDFSRAIRADFHVDPQGRRIRQNMSLPMNAAASNSLFGLICERLPGSISSVLSAEAARNRWRLPTTQDGRRQL
jgi:hypothetical protein